MKSGVKGSQRGKPLRGRSERPTTVTLNSIIIAVIPTTFTPSLRLERQNTARGMKMSEPAGS